MCCPGRNEWSFGFCRLVLRIGLVNGDKWCCWKRAGVRNISKASFALWTKASVQICLITATSNLVKLFLPQKVVAIQSLWKLRDTYCYTSSMFHQYVLRNDCNILRKVLRKVLASRPSRGNHGKSEVSGFTAASGVLPEPQGGLGVPQPDSDKL